MTIKRYGKPNSSIEHIYHTTNENPEEGLVRMNEPRPSPEWICQDNHDGTGTWIPPKRIIRIKVFLKNCMQKLRNAYYGMRRHVYINIIYITAKNGSFLLNINNIVVNLFSPNNKRKNLSFFSFISSLSVILYFKLGTSDLLGGILLSVCAAVIFDIFVVLAPKEFEKIKFARKLSQVIDEITELKNLIYISIGYLDPQNLVLENRPMQDTGMDKKKGKKLTGLIEENHNKPISQHAISFSGKQMGIDFYSKKTNEDLLLEFEGKFISNLDSLILLCHDDYFPKLSEYLSEVKYSHSKKRFPRVHIKNRIEAKKYVGELLRIIETMELLYRMEAFKYVGIIRGFCNVYLKFSKDSINSLLFSHSIFTYYE